MILTYLLDLKFYIFSDFFPFMFVVEGDGDSDFFPFALSSMCPYQQNNCGSPMISAVNLTLYLIDDCMKHMKKKLMMY